MQDSIKAQASRIFGLTGPIGCGKTTVTDILSGFGAYIIDADKIAKNVIKTDKVLNKIKEKFPEEIFDDSNNVIREKLAELIFSSDEHLNNLNSIMHPEIYDYFCKEYEQVKKDNKLIIYSAALLLNSKYNYSFLSGIIVINASKEKCMERLVKRDNISKKEAYKRIAKQMSVNEQLKSADYIIDNNGTEEELKKNIKKFLEDINYVG